MGFAFTAVFTHAIVREISRSLARCELVHLARQEFDLARAKRQHTDYVTALEAAGVTVRVLPELPDLPDASFVEDPVLILDELAIICRLGAPSRAPEAEHMAREAASLRPVQAIVAPGTLEGGDVLRVGRKLFVGQSSRTNREGIEQLARIVAPFGYEVTTVVVKKCLHLKTGATSPADGVLLINPDWIEVAAFVGFEILAVPPSEPWGANTLPVNGHVLAASASPRSAELLSTRGLDVRLLDVSELQKAEAGLTCLSVLYRGPSA